MDRKSKQRKDQKKEKDRDKERLKCRKVLKERLKRTKWFIKRQKEKTKNDLIKKVWKETMERKERKNDWDGDIKRAQDSLSGQEKWKLQNSKANFFLKSRDRKKEIDRLYVTQRD